MEKFGELLPVCIVAFVLCFGYIKGIPIFSVFTKGAKKGIYTTLGILPTLVGIITAITMLSSSGALTALANILSPLTNLIGMPSEILPLAILRPISGSGAQSVLINIFENYGTDSQIGTIASVLSASSETTFYAVSIYFGSKAYKRLSYTIPVALLGDFTAVALSVIMTKIYM